MFTHLRFLPSPSDSEATIIAFSVPQLNFSSPLYSPFLVFISRFRYRVAGLLDENGRRMLRSKNEFHSSDGEAIYIPKPVNIFLFYLSSLHFIILHLIKYNKIVCKTICCSFKSYLIFCNLFYIFDRTYTNMNFIVSFITI